ncbi:MAG: hypothetical protein WC414_03010 [Patescibacteria group bacterium]
MVEKTDYGIKQEGLSFFVVVAPHAAGDDLKTGLLARKVADELKAFLVVNKKFKKPENRRIKDTYFIEDFNNLRWGSKSQKYFWKRKKPEMKKFFKDVDLYAKKAKDFSPFKKAVVVYLHGFKSDEIGVDIGVGAKKHFCSNNIFGSKACKFLFNTGIITLKISLIKKLKLNLADSLFKNFPKKVMEYKITIGEVHSGWSKTSAIQFHRHGDRKDYAMQFEINQFFRKKENILKTSKLISRSLKKTFF